MLVTDELKILVASPSPHHPAVTMVHRSLIAAVVVALMLVGCDCGPRADSVTPPDVDDVEPIAADEFHDRLVEAVCSSYRSCGDDRFRGGVFHLFLLPVGLSFDDGVPPGVVGEFHGEFQRLKEVAEAQTPPMLPEQHCEDFTQMVAAFLGVRPSQIDEAVDDSTEYDAAAAGECVERIASPPSPCRQQRNAHGDDFNMQQYAAIARRHERELEVHYEPCERIFTGDKPENAECNYVYECADGACEWFQGEQTGRCGPDRRSHWLIP